MPYATPGVYVEEVPSSVKPIAGASTSTPVFVTAVADTATVLASSDSGPVYVSYAMPAAGKPLLFTNWSQFAAVFGGLIGDSKAADGSARTVVPLVPGKTANDKPTPPPTDANLHNLAHAVFGFFNNGGARCYVMRVAAGPITSDMLLALNVFDDISMVAAPGLLDDTTRKALAAHCESFNRFAIFDGPRTQALPFAATDLPGRTTYGATYFPWIKVFDPSAKLANGGDGIVDVPPSGHVAGVFARIDDTRGVHKAPANEVIFGAQGVSQALSKAEQGTINLKQANCLRNAYGNVLIWGARTSGGDDNADLKYVNVRRTLLFLRKSIEDGTQWIVFEPNTPSLWKSITRDVTAFLTQVWRSGALFGTTAEQAFYVKCDSETNPPANRDNGMVVTEIGVALARPAEFVVFRISQISGA